MKNNYDDAKALAEFAIDSLLKDGSIAKEIPIVNMFLLTVKVPCAIADKLFIEKLKKFLVELEKISVKEREKLLEKFAKAKEREKIGERIMLLLNSFNEAEKPELMARAFKAYVQNKIEREQLDRIWHVLDKCFLSDLYEYRKVENSVLPHENIIVLPLFALGLFESPNGIFEIGSGYKKTDFGKLVVKILFEQSD